MRAAAFVFGVGLSDFQTAAWEVSIELSALFA